MPISSRADRSHAVVVGASISGLLAAAALADFFERVTVLDRDALPDEPQPRKGAPQGQHIHALLVAGAEALGASFPGFLAELIERGAVPIDFSTGDAAWFQHGVWKRRACRRLIVHSQTRPLLEQHLRERLAKRPNVAIRAEDTALRLALEDGGARVGGIFARNGASGEETLWKADLVVDASGRNSAAPKWLEAAGYERPGETSVDVRIGYASRFYQSPPDGAPPWKALAVYAKAPVSTKSGVVFKVEGDRWIVTLMGCLGDYPPVDDVGFLEFARQLDDPAVFDWLRNAVPLTQAMPYRFPSHLRRHYERLTRFPAGFLVLGDAMCSLNPIYGQGMSVCALEARALHECLARGLAGPELWRTFFQRAARIIESPWSIATGADFLYPRVEGVRPWDSVLRNWYLKRVLEATGRDPRVTTCFYEVLQLLRKPAALFRPEILVRVLAVSRRRYL